MQEGKVVTGCLLIAGGNASVLLDAAKEPLDFVSVRIQVHVEYTLDRSVLLWWDDRFRLQRFDVCNERVTIKALVADNRSRLEACNQWFCLGDICLLAWCQNEA